MCTIDWSALGTWAAVVVALGISVYQGLAERWREKREGVAIAMLLETDLATIASRADALVHELDGQTTGGMLDFFLESDPTERRRLARLAEDFPTANMEAIAARTHVLPLDVTRKLLRLLATVREVRQAGRALSEMSPQFAEANMEGFLNNLRKHVASLLDHARAAGDACRSVAGA